MKFILIAFFAVGCDAANGIPTAPPVDNPTYSAGQSYFGRNRYIEYLAGSLPVILTAPHGGDLQPGEIPDRTAQPCGGSATVVRDTNTAELVLAIRDTMFARFGAYPHVIISHLNRRKLDPNRPLTEAACGDPEAEIAWSEFQAFVDSAASAVTRRDGRGWYMDMHGHGHAIQRLELGYLVSGANLDRSDDELNANAAFEDASSIRTISKASALTFARLLRGPQSLGALYASNGFPAVPGTTPGPGGASYFDGGYNTARHTCSIGAGSASAAICGIQIEANFAGVRDSPSSRGRFAAATATVLAAYLKAHAQLELRR